MQYTSRRDDDSDAPRKHRQRRRRLAPNSSSPPSSSSWTTCVALDEGTDVAEAVVERRRRHPQNVGPPQIREDVRLLQSREDALDGPVIEFD